jgi:AcrR family transcriptional regulator
VSVPPSPAPESRKRLPAARRRSQLLEVALERFAASGFHGTSMEEIADAAGVTKPVLYQHFGSKRTLYLELLETVGEELLEAVATRAAAEVEPYQRVLAGFRAYFQFVGERTSAFQVLFGHGSRQTDEFADVIGTVEASVAGAIAAFIDADIEESHRNLLGVAIVGLGEVTARLWISRHDESDESGDRGDDRLDPAEAEVLAVRLSDLVWAGLRGLPGGTRP